MKYTIHSTTLVCYGMLAASGSPTAVALHPSLDKVTPPSPRRFECPVGSTRSWGLGIPEGHVHNPL